MEVAQVMKSRGRTGAEAGRGAPKAPVRAPERTCAACRVSGPPESMVRWVRDESGAVYPDLRGSAFGRGAWLHPRVGCLARIVPALSRSFRAPVTTTPEEAVVWLKSAGDKRVRDLLGAARRQRMLALGSDATEDALAKGLACAVLVAQDARAAAETPGVRRAVVEGLACAWGTKERIGQVVGRPEVGVLAILEDRLATALFDAIALAHLQGPPPKADGTLGGADVSTEVE